MSTSRLIPLIVATAVMGLIGCASTRVCSTRSYETDLPEATIAPEDDVTIVYGTPNRFADGMGTILGLPGRLLTLQHRINDHQFSSETKDKLLAYLEDNQIADVYVRVNQYDPIGEWRRLHENSAIAPGWRYSVGLAGLAVYTVVPGRVFGGDHYNPFTNSLYINSDVSAVVLHEAAYAKDIRRRAWPGTYAAANELPVISLWRHIHAVDDVLGYARHQQDWELEQETYRIVYPQLGVHASVLGGPFVSPLEGPLLQVGGALAGRAIGEWSIARRQHGTSTDAPGGAPAHPINLVGYKATEDHEVDVAEPPE